MSARVRQVDLGRSPEEVMRAWGPERPLAALCSVPPGDEGHRWAGWTILAETEPAICIGGGAEEPDPLARMFDHIGAAPGAGAPRAPIPFVGGWIVALGYELGRIVEPSAAVGGRGGERVSPDWPWPIVLWRCPGALVYDHAEKTWWSVGGAAERFDGSHGRDRGYSVGALAREVRRESFERSVARAVEYIRAGDVFEVNLSHRLAAEFSGSARAAFVELLRGAGPWYGAYLEVAHGGAVHAALSASPELFLELDGRTGLITSRPIKGTRPRGGSAALERSEKDRAELNMIVDLMRNDIGRVSRVGTVRVGEARAIERHGGSGRGGVLHGVATVHGELRAGAGLEALVRAAFPAGSITGAPKVRAMQIIEELEPCARGLYTGSIGFISDGGGACFSVAIRTAVVRGRCSRASDALDEIHDGRLSYGVGAGIVADSEPGAEFRETMDKAGVLRGLARRCGAHA